MFYCYKPRIFKIDQWKNCLARTFWNNKYSPFKNFCKSFSIYRNYRRTYAHRRRVHPAYSNGFCGSIFLRSGAWIQRPSFRKKKSYFLYFDFWNRTFTYFPRCRSPRNWFAIIITKKPATQMSARVCLIKIKPLQAAELPLSKQYHGSNEDI